MKNQNLRDIYIPHAYPYPYPFAGGESGAGPGELGQGRAATGWARHWAKSWAEGKARGAIGDGRGQALDQKVSDTPTRSGHGFST